MARFVADRVGVDLGGPDTVEETIGKGPADEPDGSGVMGVDDAALEVPVDEARELARNFAQRLIPGDGGEFALALGADALERP